jgi:hypothetical protein
MQRHRCLNENGKMENGAKVIEDGIFWIERNSCGIVINRLVILPHKGRFVHDAPRVSAMLRFSAEQQRRKINGASGRIIALDHDRVNAHAASDTNLIPNLQEPLTPWPPLPSGEGARG